MSSVVKRIMYKGDVKRVSRVVKRVSRGSQELTREWFSHCGWDLVTVTVFDSAVTLTAGPPGSMRFKMIYQLESGTSIAFCFGL